MFICSLGLLILQPTPTYLFHQGVLKSSPLNPVSEYRKIRGNSSGCLMRYIHVQHLSGAPRVHPIRLSRLKPLLQHGRVLEL